MKRSHSSKMRTVKEGIPGSAAHTLSLILCSHFPFFPLHFHPPLVDKQSHYSHSEENESGYYSPYSFCIYLCATEQINVYALNIPSFFFT